MSIELYQVIIAVWVVMQAIQISLFALDPLIEFWTRGREKPQFGVKFFLKRHSIYPYEKTDAGKHGWHKDYYWFCEFFFGSIIVGCLAGAVYTFGLTPIILIASIVAFFIVPRYAADLLHSLRYNFKKKDSERIAELEKQVKQLKRRA